MSTTSLQELLITWLGQTIGYSFGKLAAILIQIFIVWLIWWFPCSRIAHKAGFRGSRYWVIMHTIGTGPLTAFCIFLLFGQTSPMSAIASFLSIGIYLGIWLLALIPSNKT